MLLLLLLPAVVTVVLVLAVLCGSLYIVVTFFMMGLKGIISGIKDPEPWD